jgi:LysR family pca operon transcriptional activator
VLPVIIERLAAGAYDFVVGDEPDEPLEAAFTVEPLLTNRSVLVGSPAHPLAGADGVTARDLAGFRWVGLGPFARIRTALVEFFGDQGLALPANILETSSLELVLDALKDPDVLTVLPRELVLPELAAGTVAEIPAAIRGPRWNIVLMSRADIPRSPQVEDFVDALRAVAGELEPGGVGPGP